VGEGRLKMKLSLKAKTLSKGGVREVHIIESFPFISKNVLPDYASIFFISD
jgi:hypothetical protein